MYEYDDYYGEAIAAASPHINISIIQNDDVCAVDASLWINGKSYHVIESSRRDPGDSSNPETGLLLAVGRAVRQLGRNILKDGQSNVRDEQRIVEQQRAAAEKARAKKAENAQDNRFRRPNPPDNSGEWYWSNEDWHHNVFSKCTTCGQGLR